MRGLLLLGTFAAIPALLITGDLASDAPTFNPITEERICTEEDIPPAFNLGDALPQNCQLKPAQERQQP